MRPIYNDSYFEFNFMHNYFAIQQHHNHCFYYFYFSKMYQFTIPVEGIDKDAKHTLNHANSKT